MNPENQNYNPAAAWKKIKQKDRIFICERSEVDVLNAVADWEQIEEEERHAIIGTVYRAHLWFVRLNLIPAAIVEVAA